jgi:phenylalanyl-tRNA synthetase alpha chain
MKPEILQEQIDKQIEQMKEKIVNAKLSAELNELKVMLLGKKGKITEMMKIMKDLPSEDRPEFGKRMNMLRGIISSAIEKREEELKGQEQSSRLEEEKIDISLPGKRNKIGSYHPITKGYYEIRDIFLGMGFDIMEGPEIEYDKYNFEMLNIPKDHPARDMQDTFYVSEDIVLRTHTSPVQIRTMLDQKPPIRMICPGRVYRTDDVDATHSPVFNQIEGLVVGEGITFGDLKATLHMFLKELYGEETKIRFRPGHFPFTEPSGEVDATCKTCGGKGCSVCKGSGMIELLGCGMVHPNVLRNCGIDPDIYSGFAFGLGLDRIVNIKNSITDIRLLFENDVRFLKQFR